VTDAVEGELLFPGDRRYGPRQALAVRAQIAGSDITQAAHFARHVATHDVTRAVAREVAYIPGGVRAVSVWLWENGTGAGLAQDVKEARARGDFEALMKLRQLQVDDRHQRFERVMAYILAPQKILKALVVLFLILFGALFGMGIAAAIAFDDKSLVLGPLHLVMWCAAGLVAICVLYGAILPWVVLGVVVLALWVAGRRAGDVPEFLAPAEVKKARREEITPGMAVLAFRDLGIAELRKRILALPDNGASMISQIRPAGCGVEFDATPPRGATSTEVILARHRRLSENINRHPYEVHLSIPRNAPGTVRVWAADIGALDEPIGPSPLAWDEDIKADYKRGAAPWGMTLRNDPAEIRLHQIHVLVTGKSNQGKSVALRSLALWLALDKTVELRIVDLKGMNPTTKRSDWAMFEGIATEFLAGPSDDHVIEATEMLERAVAEMNRRLQEGGHWDPLVVIVDEAQVAYMCPAKGPDGRPYGGSKNTSRYLTAVRQLQNQGRAVDVLLWQGTQDPTNQNLPVLAREGAHLRACLAVGTEEKARMALGDNAIEGGAAPHRLRPGLDKGTLVVTGDGAPLGAGQASVTIRTHFNDDADAERIADRAKKLRGPVAPADPDEVRDLLQDVHEVFGQDDRVRAAHLADRLRETFPRYRAYRSINGTGLVAALAEAGVVVEPGQGRHFAVKAERVLRTMDERDGVYG
jgi:DNA segregation ATPase FtsK/SpoIIIE, S-DNA-T family